MPFRLEKRAEPSRLMLYLTPVAAVILTMLVGGITFSLIGYDGFGAVREIFVGRVDRLAQRVRKLGARREPLVGPLCERTRDGDPGNQEGEQNAWSRHRHPT